MVGDLAACTSLVVVSPMSYVKVLSDCGCEVGYVCKPSAEQIKWQREFYKVTGKTLLPQKVPGRNIP